MPKSTSMKDQLSLDPNKAGSGRRRTERTTSKKGYRGYKNTSQKEWFQH